MAPAHERDRAERTPVIAPFADLEVPDVRQLTGEQTHARVRDRRIVEQPALDELRHETVHLARAKEEIDLGECRLELGLVTFDHASHGHDRAGAATFLEAPRLYDRVDRFLLRGI